MTAAIWVALGGACGSVLRYWGTLATARLLGDAFPWGTLFVNVIGSALIGIIAVLDAPEGRFALPEAVRPLILVGLFGGFTTFSSFSLQTLSLVEQGRWSLGAANVLLSVSLCMVGVWLGSHLGHFLNR
ncbi:MAG: fluoride efflux transporter CrcB [Pseudomonadota bacterium]